MPSRSLKQHVLMEAVAHNPAFAKKVGIPQSVGQDFADHDKATGNFMGPYKDAHSTVDAAPRKLRGKRKK